MQDFFRRLFRLSSPKKFVEQDKETVKAFRKKYANFRKLLDANAVLAELLADLEEKLNGNKLFGMIYVKNTAQQALQVSRRMATSLQGMSGGRYKRLTTQLDAIEASLHEIIQENISTVDCPYLTLPFSRITYDQVDWVGGKCANLGELLNKAMVSVPRGFAITVQAFHSFMAHEGLGQSIQEKLAFVNLQDREGMVPLLAEIQADIEAAALPPALAAELEKAWVECFGDDDVAIAVRSSAQVEDGEKSFAGQFISELYIRRDEVAESYKRVIASLFAPSATLYRLHQGIPLSASAMAVACLEMVDAVSSGVVYTHDPVDLLNETVVINGVWGLGKYAVDGIVPPDVWVFTRGAKPALVRRKSGKKNKMLQLDASGSLADMPVPDDLQRVFSLTEDEVEQLAIYSLHIEKAFGCYQDIEWAKDRKGQLIFLQSRPFDTRSGSSHAPKPPLLEEYPLLVTSPDIACHGVGSGPVVKPQTQDDLGAFPQGGVLVAAHSNAEYAQVMDRAQAVVTETGGITGHMASICREFHVPCIVNAPKAMELLQEGDLITLDAFNGYVYRGIVEELLPLRLNLETVRLEDTEVYRLLQKVAKLITPLHLTDPNDASFSAGNCTTVHDVMRFVHERSYQEMFAISDSATDAGRVALKLMAPLPIDLYIIDLDGGMTVDAQAEYVKPEEITSAPLVALLKGMLRPDTMFRRPRPINMSGFFSVMGQQIATPQGGERFGDKSYAIISDRYMNFSSRVGYHYSVLDAYCGATDSKNYISFTFQGGAAGETRRVRRCKSIALILKALGFSVIQQEDMVKARFQKYPKAIIEDRMDQLGRLLQVTRQMDMLMTDDASIARFKENFMQGIYQ